MISMGATQHTAVVTGMCMLVEMDFKVGTQYLTNAPQNLTIGPLTYLGLGGLIKLPDLHESVDSDEEKLTLGLSIVDTALIALSLGAVDGYRGRPVRIYFQMMSADFLPVGPVVHRWSGSMDKIVINRTPASTESGDDSTGMIEMQCSRSGMARARNYQGLRLTHQQQQLRFPGDTGLRYMRVLIDQPTLWLSKNFQKQQ